MTKIRLLALPRHPVAEMLWEKTHLIPPEDLLERAEQALQVPGLSRGAYPIEMVPAMTDAELKAFINRMAGSSRWTYFYVDTEGARYVVVVIQG